MAVEQCKAAEEQATNPPAPEAAALAFAHDMDAGDAAAAKEVSFGGENELRLIDAMTAMTRSHRRLVAAAVAKFGKRGKELGGSYAEPGLEAMVRRSALTVDGETAVVREKPGVIFLKLWKSPGGQWKIDVAGCMADYAIDEIRALERASHIADKAADEVGTGLYASVDDVKSAMTEMGYPREDAKQDETVPATRPAK